MLFWILVVAGTVFFFTKNLKRLFQVTGGLMLLAVYNNLWDIGIWPVVQAIFRFWGIVVLTGLALISNFLVLRFYQKYCKTDWLGITVVDDIVCKANYVKKQYYTALGIRKIFLGMYLVPLFFAKKIIIGKWIPIVVLALLTDGFVATAYYINQKKEKDKPIKPHCFGRNEYIVLALTTIVSCVAWSVFTELITLPAFRNLWQTLPL